MKLTKWVLAIMVTTSIALFAQDREKAKQQQESAPGPSHAGMVVDYEGGPFDNREVRNLSAYSGGFLWTHVVHIPEATFVKVYFENYRLLPGDHLDILDDKGNVRQRIFGSGPAGQASFWSLSVPGDTLILQIDSATDYSKRFAFQITRAFRGEMDLFALPEPVESICSDPRASPYRSAWCYSPGQPFEDPSMWQNAQATVGVLTIGNYNTGSWCSGSLVSSQDYILTNQHCIEDISDCQNVEFVFNYYRNTCEENIGGEDPIVTQGYYCDFTDNTTFFTNPFLNCTSQNLNDLDYAFAHVLLNGADPPPSEVYTPLQMELDHSAIENTLEMYIIGHPEGNARVVSEGEMDFTDDFSLHYVCDTRGGSSGSPVFSRATHRLIGLHHCGGCNTPGVRNRGMFIDQIRADIDMHGGFFDPRAVLYFQSVSYSDLSGDGDGFFDLGEVIDVEVVIANSGDLASESGMLTLTSTDPNVEILAGPLAIPPLDPITRGSSVVLDLSFRLNANFQCGSPIPLTFTATYGAFDSVASASLDSGEFVLDGNPVDETSTDTPISIPDNVPAGISSTISVPAPIETPEGATVTIVEEVEVNITHTYIGDLLVTLESPNGTTVTLHNQTGGTTNNLYVVYGDGSNGTVIPSGNLDDFAGDSIAGNWTLFVSDNAGQDVGTLDDWRIKASTGSFDCTSSDGFVEIGSQSSQYGASIDVPVSLSDPTAEVFAFDIVYDPAKLQYSGNVPDAIGGCATGLITHPGAGTVHVEADCSTRGAGLLHLFDLQFEVVGISGDTLVESGNHMGDLASFRGGTGVISLPDPNTLDPCTVGLSAFASRWGDPAYYDAVIDINDNAVLEVMDLVHRVGCP